MKSPYIKYIALSINLAICALILLPLGAHAITTPDTYTPLAPLPDLSTLQPQPTVSFKTYVTYVFNLLIALGAVAAVFEITWGGFEYMTTDAVSGKKDGLKRIQNAIYGLLLILCSYLILKTIDPRFVSIPSSLVPPLQTNGNGATYQTTDQTLINNQRAGATADQTAAQNNIDSLGQQLNDAMAASDAACIDPNTTSQQCADAMNKEATIQNQLDQANANASIAGYSSAILATNPGQSVSSFTNAENTAYNNALQQIKTSGGDNASAIAALNQVHAINQATLQAAQNSVQSNPQAAASLLNSVQENTRSQLQNFSAQ